ncbi:hypothetical protein ACXR2U_13060 [Jatrophihabitans sp. YIM 134969]
MTHDDAPAIEVLHDPPAAAAEPGTVAAPRSSDGVGPEEPARTITPELLATLAGNAAATESAGRLAPASLDALRAAGCFSTAGTVAAWQDPRQLAADLQVLGAACPASAWVVALTTAVTGLLPFASAAARSTLAAANSPVIENFAPGSLTSHDDGFLLDGTWPYCSGSEVATYAMLGALLVEAGRPPRMRMAVVPTAELRLVRTWDVAGLQGTGSHTFVAENVHVADDFVFDLPADPQVTGRATLLTTTLTSAAIVGMARGALGVVTALVHSGKGPSRTRYTSYAASPGARALFARSRAQITDAAARVDAVAAELARHPAAGDPEPFDLSARLELRRSLIAAVRDARSAVDDLLDLHGSGSSAFPRSNPLQRFWRDIGVGSRHAGLRGYLLDEDLARALLGRDDYASTRW